SGYKWLTGNVNLAQTLGVPNFTLDYRGGDDGRPATNAYYRRVRLKIEPIEDGGATKYQLSAEMQVSKQGAFQEVLSPVMLDEIPPTFLKVGFAAVTGGRTHYHEVRNLTITTPGGV